MKLCHLRQAISVALNIVKVHKQNVNNPWKIRQQNNRSIENPIECDRKAHMEYHFSLELCM
jgi:hypothetical protein